MAVNILINGTEVAPATILLAHGAGSPMDSAWMQGTAMAIATAGLRVVRFEFDYMAARREGRRKPPPGSESLMAEYLAAVEQIPLAGHPIIGGKSMGGRVASLVADDLHAAGKIVGLLCLGYPFHPPGKPAQLRTKHLMDLKTPALICQRTRDELGSREEVSNYELSDRIEMLWLQDGDHDLKPRKRLSGITVEDHLRTLAVAVWAWSARISE